MRFSHVEPSLAATNAMKEFCTICRIHQKYLAEANLVTESLNQRIRIKFVFFEETEADCGPVGEEMLFQELGVLSLYHGKKSHCFDFDFFIIVYFRPFIAFVLLSGSMDMSVNGFESLP